MDAFTFLALLTGGALAVNLLGALTKRASAYVNRVNDGAAPEPPPQDNFVVQEEPQENKEKRAAWWWKRLLSPEGMFGLIVSPLQVPILLINSDLIAATFEIILGRAGLPLFWINLWGWEREVTNFDLYGVLVSLGQMISGSAYYHAKVEDGEKTVIRWVALAALLGLVGFEVGASIYRGLKLDGPWNAALSGAIALGISATEVVAGTFMLHFFLVPLLLALPWLVTSPIWALLGWWERRKVRRHRFWVRRRTNPLALALAYPLAIVDQAAMEPLRRLDSAVARLISRDKRESSKGGQGNVEKVFEERHESVPSDGSDVTGLRDQTAQTSNPMDHSSGHHYDGPQ